MFNITLTVVWWLSGLACTTTGGKSCIFPFRYNGVIYTDCTLAGNAYNDPNLWCSTQTTSGGTHVTGRWGNCAPECLTPSTDPCRHNAVQTHIPNPADPSCTTYITCLSGKTDATRNCPSGTKFSFALQTCDHDYNVHDCGTTVSTSTVSTTDVPSTSGKYIASLNSQWKQLLSHDKMHKPCFYNFLSFSHPCWEPDSQYVWKLSLSNYILCLKACR